MGSRRSCFFVALLLVATLAAGQSVDPEDDEAGGPFTASPSPQPAPKPGPTALPAAAVAGTPSPAPKPAPKPAAAAGAPAAAATPATASTGPQPAPKPATADTVAAVVPVAPDAPAVGNITKGASRRNSSRTGDITNSTTAAVGRGSNSTPDGDKELPVEGTTLLPSRSDNTITKMPDAGDQKIPGTNISTTGPATTGTPVPGLTPDAPILAAAPAAPSRPQKSVGTIVGAVVGSVVGLALLISLGVLICLQHRKNSRRQATPLQPSSSGLYGKLVGVGSNAPLGPIYRSDAGNGNSNDQGPGAGGGGYSASQVYANGRGPATGQAPPVVQQPQQPQQQYAQQQYAQQQYAQQQHPQQQYAQQQYAQQQYPQQQQYAQQQYPQQQYPQQQYAQQQYPQQQYAQQPQQQQAPWVGPTNAPQPTTSGMRTSGMAAAGAAAGFAAAAGAAGVATASRGAPAAAADAAHGSHRAGASAAGPAGTSRNAAAATSKSGEARDLRSRTKPSHAAARATANSSAKPSAGAGLTRLGSKGAMDVGFTGDEMQAMLVDLKYTISNRLLPAVDCSPAGMHDPVAQWLDAGIAAMEDVRSYNGGGDYTASDTFVIDWRTHKLWDWLNHRFWRHVPTDKRVIQAQVPATMSQTEFARQMLSQIKGNPDFEPYGTAVDAAVRALIKTAVAAAVDSGMLPAASAASSQAAAEAYYRPVLTQLCAAALQLHLQVQGTHDKAVIFVPGSLEVPKLQMPPGGMVRKKRRGGSVPCCLCERPGVFSSDSAGRVEVWVPSEAATVEPMNSSAFASR